MATWTVTQLEDSNFGPYNSRRIKILADSSTRDCNTGLNLAVKGVIHLGGTVQVPPAWVLNSNDGTTVANGHIYNNVGALGDGLTAYCLVLY